MKKRSRIIKQSFSRERFSRFTSAEIKVIARELRKIASEDPEGRIRTRRVLELARNPRHPLHPIVYALNDHDAAERHRLDVVRRMCRAVRVSWTDQTGEVLASMPMLLSVQTVSTKEQKDGEEKALVAKAYVLSERAMSDPATRKEILDEALRQQDYWRLKYERYTELWPIVAAIERTRASIEGGARRRASND